MSQRVSEPRQGRDPSAEKRDTNPFATDAAPDGAEKLLAVNVSHGLRRGLHDGATAVAEWQFSCLKLEPMPHVRGHASNSGDF